MINRLMSVATEDDDTGKFDFPYLILVVNVGNGKDWAFNFYFITRELSEWCYF
jgi:hypothetical protein